MSYIVNIGLNSLCRPDDRLLSDKKAMDLKFYYTVKSMRYLSDGFLLAALAMALYDHCSTTNDVTVAVLAMLSFFVVPIALALSYYFQMQHIRFLSKKRSHMMYSLWIGALIGVNTLMWKLERVDIEVGQQLVDYLLILHIGMFILWIVTERITGLAQFDTKFMHESELFSLIGFAVAGFMLKSTMTMFIDICLFLLALAVTVVSIRIKSNYFLINLASLSAISYFGFFPALNIAPSSFLIVIAFITGLVAGPFFDLYFNPSSVFERYLSLFRVHHFWRLLLVASLGSLQFLFMLSCSNVVFFEEGPKYFTVPGFIFFACLWLCFHLIYFLTLCNFMTRITDCMLLISNLDENVPVKLSEIMASKGMRYFCIISQRLVLMTALTTATVGWVSWQSDTIYISLFLIILPIELLTLALLDQLSSSVGGTCVGYAIIAPNNLYRIDGTVTPLPQNHIEDVNVRSSELLVAIQNFFRDHLIDMYDCDYSAIGSEPLSVENKVKALFNSNTKDGVKYDSYILYYCGHTYQNGDWAMKDGSAVSLANIVEWWKEKVDENSSRLIIMVDSLYGYKWKEQVKASKNICIGLQSLRIPDTKKRDVDLSLRTGEFTRDWIKFNSSGGHSQTKDLNGFSIPQFAYYVVSPNWTDYTFKLPTGSDFINHSQLHFPRITWRFIEPLLSQLTYPLFSHPSSFSIRPFLRRLKMKWFPPKILHTGHGFYFVRA